ncbi:unnamed protein product [Orchesella dallaii]|uniref:Uncharacterized protein n=1 Tax=Orchesella dallaii TaxID=48710 RepID=A0ABP1RIL6_9HEXA
MKIYMKILLVLGLAVYFTRADDCWWTGCQLRSWAVRGCDQYKRFQNGTQPCRSPSPQRAQGDMYNCCLIEGCGEEERVNDAGKGSNCTFVDNGGRLSREGSEGLILFLFLTIALCQFQCHTN